MRGSKISTVSTVSRVNRFSRVSRVSIAGLEGGGLCESLRSALCSLLSALCSTFPEAVSRTDRMLLSRSIVSKTSRIYVTGVLQGWYRGGTGVVHGWYRGVA
jgi:hypothetical protein